MRKCILILIFILFSQEVHSQYGWEYISPTPTPNIIDDIFFVNQSTGYLVAYFNNVMKTTDEGESWLNIASPYFDTYNSIYFINKDTGCISGGSRVLKTTNGGDDWYICHTGSGTNLHFINSQIGFMTSLYSSPYVLFKTSNSGDSWDPTGNIPDNYGCLFLNENTGFSIGNTLHKTTDGGSTWVQKISINNWLRDIKFVNQSTGFAVGLNGKIIKTTNGGDNWVSQGSGTNNHLTTLYCLDENIIYVSGDEIVLKSINSGASWINYNLGSNVDVNSMTFSSLDKGYLVGALGIYFKTTNGGVNWTSKKSGFSEVLNSIHFPSKDTGYVAGNWGLVGKTTNGGSNWITQNTGATQIINCINFPNNNTGFIVGNYGTAYKTTNGGENWDSLNLQGNLYTVYFLDPNTGFVGGNGATLKTTNGGLNWNTFNISLSSFRKIYFYNNVNGYILSGAKIFKTTDSGSNWDLLYTYSGVSGASLTDVYFPSSEIGYASVRYSNMSSWGSIILKTTNGGYNWEQQYQVQGFPIVITSLYFKNNNAGFAVAEGLLGYILNTTSGGANWEILPTISTSGLKDISFTSEDTGYIIGGRGTILKTTNFGGIITSLNNISPDIIPKSFSLRQNYPNPFNPSTKIKFDIPRGTLVKLKVYDLLGREVAELVNEKLNAGVYEYEWSGVGLPSGVYFYKLEANDYIETKKMLLIK